MPIEPTVLAKRQKRTQEVRLICSKYGRIKTAITQGLREGSRDGVCAAIVENWLHSGFVLDSQDPKKYRREFRQQWTDGVAVPQQIVDQHAALVDPWERLERKFIGQIMPILGETIFELIKPSKEDNGAAYFYMRLDVFQSADCHAVGLKRGKLQKDGARYYTLFDPNYFEVTHIANLSTFLDAYKPVGWESFFKCDLNRMAKKQPQPAAAAPQPVKKDNFDELMALMRAEIES